MRYRNTTYALIDGLRDVLSTGEPLHVRGERSSELRNRLMVIERPRERCIVAPERNNNIFAAIAETMWVLAGRSDLAFLAHYVPRAPDFSDDGAVWRAGYGPRLRHWRGVDQIRENLTLLRHELGTRRAVMSIFDPAVDFVASKDIPCNNWFHWLARDGRLHLNVAIRSNDIIWGFSGINAFEWSVLHEMMASWLDLAVGEMTFFASSFHLYQRHERRAHAIVRTFPGVTCYEFGLEPPPFQVAWEEFDDALREWFTLEGHLRDVPDSLDRAITGIADPLLGQFLRMLQIYNGAKLGWSPTEIDGRLAALPESDLTVAAYEHFRRRKQRQDEVEIPHPAIAGYWARQSTASAGVPTGAEEMLRRTITRLHAEKSAAYGNSWKRRGEQIGILANIARKVDRLERIASGTPATCDESLCDTAVDLLVYCLKYQTFLADCDDGVAAAVFDPTRSGLQPPYSDGVAGFDELVERADLRAIDGEGEGVFIAAGQVIARFVDLEACFLGSGEPTPAAIRLIQVQQLTTASIELIGALRRESPGMYRRFLATRIGE